MLFYSYAVSLCANGEVSTNLILQEVKMRMKKNYDAPNIELRKMLQDVGIAVTTSSWVDETGGDQGGDDPF